MNEEHIIETMEDLKGGMEVILEDIKNVATFAGTDIPMEDAVFDLCEQVLNLRDYWVIIKTFEAALRK